MTTLTLNRGETLGILATPKNNGATIVLDGTWSVAAAIAPAGSTSGEIDMGATISGGKVSIQYDTVDLSAGAYNVDIRITKSVDTWTEKIRVNIKEPVTKPSARA